MAQKSSMAQKPTVAMASLNASLLAPKGAAQPAVKPPILVPVSTPAVGRTRRFADTDKRPQGSQTAPDVQKTATGKKTKKKSLRISAAMDKDLRLLAVRNGQSQQALLEQAVSDYLDKAYASGECMCRR